MRFFRIIISAIVLGGLLNGCAGLGTPNTPTPSPLTNFTPVFAPHEMWFADVGSGVKSDYLKLGPVFSNGTIFVANANGKVVALNARTGKSIWRKQVGASISSGPAAGQGLVVISTKNAQLVALNASTGAEVWHVAMPNEALAAPQIAENTVVVTTVNGSLCAFAASNGQALWVYDHTAPTLMLRGGSTPQIVGDKVVAAFADGKLAAFNLSQGNILWEQTIAAPLGASQTAQMVDIVAAPVITDGEIFVATYQGNIAKVALQSGQILWQQQISSYTGLTLNPAYVIVTDASGAVWAFSRDTGAVVWRQTQLLNRVLTAPALMNDMVVVADGEGYVHWLRQLDGRLAARAIVDKKVAIFAAPVVVDNSAFVADTNGTVAAFNM